MKTIKELADELGVSKTAVRKHMTEDFRAAHTANLTGNTIGIDEAGCKLLAESLRKPLQTTENQFAETPETTANPGLQEEVAFLRERIRAMDRQLEAKDRQLEAQQAQLATKETEVLNLTEALKNAQSSLKAAQALHAGTMQKQLDAGDPQTEVAIDADLEDLTPDEPQAAPEPKKRRQSFWAWLKGE